MPMGNSNKPRCVRLSGVRRWRALAWERGAFCQRPIRYCETKLTRPGQPLYPAQGQQGHACRPARFARFKEELEQSVPGWGQRRSVENRRIEILGALAFSRTRSRQDEATNQLGVAQRQVLSDIAPQREAEQIDLPQLEGVEEVKSVLRHSSHV